MRGTKGGTGEAPIQGYVCSTCGKQYRHSSHLRRHEASHLTPEGLQCHFCQKSFSRRDVWRKHYTTCPNNINHEDPPQVKRGKKPRACDPCFRSKLACDGSLSCGRCKSRQVACIYTRVHADGSDAAPVPTSSISTPSTASTSARDDSTKIPVSFLLSLTNPKAESMVEAFFDEPGRDDDAPSVDLQTTPDTIIARDAMEVDGLFLPWGFGQISYDILPDFNFSEPECTTPTVIDPALSPLLTDLKNLHANLLTTDPSYDGTFNDTLAAQIFTRANIDAFIPAYFRHTHHNMPLIHRPSFNPTTCPAPLLLTICFCGAVNSPPRDCVLAVPSFFRIAEEYIFRLLDTALAKHNDKSDTFAPTEEKETELYETLQAALLINGVQYMTTNPAARRRNWMVRRPALVAAVRGLGLMGARHTQIGGQRPEWRRFVRDESRIRIAVTALLADWLQSSMWNVPVLVTIQELTGQMPCLQELWEANDAAEFEAVIASKGEDCWRRPASLRDGVDALMSEGWSGVGRFPLGHLSLLDLQLFMFALQVIVGISRHMSLLAASAPALLRAMDRWEELWRAVAAKLGDEKVRTSGYARHSGELCWLARKTIAYSLAGKDRTAPYFQVIGHESLKALHELLRELRGARWYD